MNIHSLHTPSDHGAVNDSLRLLTAPHALHFGNELLSRSQGGTIAFGTFVDIAREWVEHLPEETAFYLASLIALDMCDDDAETLPIAAPSRN
ncbi:MAG: hypothetical protein RL398_1381 [Planctomycetota bacterium]|jgi:hypothetical protein